MDRKIFFSGVEMPAPKVNGGLVETYEDVWSANTGRNSAGSMVGTLVATKAKLKFSWNALSWEEAARIKSAIYGKGFTTCTYPGVDGQTHTVTGYFGITSIQPVLFSRGTTASVPASPSMVSVALRNTPPRAAKEMVGQPLSPSAL